MISHDEKLQKAEDAFVEGAHTIGLLWGFNSVESKIIGYLVAQDKPISLNDLTENLRISKGNISVCIRKLEEKQIVKNVWIKGDRRDYYELTLELWQVFLKKMQDNYRIEAHIMLSAINTTIEQIQGSFSQLGEGGGDKARTFMQKIQKLKTYYTIAEDVAKTVEQYGVMDVSKVRLLWGSLKPLLKIHPK